MCKEDSKRQRAAIKETSIVLWKDTDDHRNEEARVINVCTFAI